MAVGELPSHAFHQQAEHLAHAPFLVAMRLQVRRPPLQIHPFVHLQHHRLVAERARRGLRVAVGVVDADGIAVVLEEVDGIVEQRLVGSRPVVVEADAHVHVAHVVGEGVAVEQQRALAQLPFQLLLVALPEPEQQGLVGLWHLAAVAVEVAVDDALADVVHRVVPQPLRIHDEPREGEAHSPDLGVPCAMKQIVGVPVRQAEDHLVDEAFVDAPAAQPVVVQALDGGMGLIQNNPVVVHKLSF